jgi:hypothetical protein
MTSQRPKLVVVAAILLALLGLARAVGGGVLLLVGRQAAPEIIASDRAVTLVAVGLVTIGVLAMVSAVGIWRLQRRYLILGVIVTIAFVINGAVNGLVLFGWPGEAGTLVNAVVAALILRCLWVTRHAFVARREA